MITKEEEFAALGIKAELFQIIQAINHCGTIFLSDYFTAMNLNLLKRNSISGVLTIAKGFSLPYPKSQIPNYLYIPIEDKSSVKITDHFDRCFKFIDEVREKGNVLVHCKAGVSRSVTIIIAYLMNNFHYSLDNSYRLVKRVNPKVRPNPGFMAQLEQYQLQKFGEPQFIVQISQSLRNSPVNKKQQEIPSTPPKRQKSLTKVAKDLQGTGWKLSQKLSKIKKMLLEENSKRQRSHSEYLNKKMAIMKQKQLKNPHLSEKADLQTLLTRKLNQKKIHILQPK